MVEQLAIVSGKILATVVIPAIGLMLLRRIIWFELAEMLEGSLTQFSLRGIAVTLTVVMGVFTLHGIEIGLYTGLCLLLGACPTCIRRSTSRPSLTARSATTTRASTASSCSAGRPRSSSRSEAV